MPKRKLDPLPSAAFQILLSLAGEDLHGYGIMRQVAEQTDGRIAYALKVFAERGIVMSGDALKDGIGAMSSARWQSFYESMVAVGVLPAGLDVARTHTLEFVNKGIGKP